MIDLGAWIDDLPFALGDIASEAVLPAAVGRSRQGLLARTGAHKIRACVRGRCAPHTWSCLNPHAWEYSTC